jgi:hypothetical protein
MQWEKVWTKGRIANMRLRSQPCEELDSERIRPLAATLTVAMLGFLRRLYLVRQIFPRVDPELTPAWPARPSTLR